MDWLDNNLLAYRVVAEILVELRAHFRATLRQRHPGEDYTAGLPEAVKARLIAAKEEEQAVDWHESEYRELLDYAVFPDLLAMVENDPSAFRELTTLAPSSAMLSTRFLELEVMRAKLGMARPLSEAEVSFLGTFHLRLRRAIREQAAPPTPPPATPPAPRAASGPEAETDSHELLPVELAETGPTSAAAETQAVLPAPEAGRVVPEATAPAAADAVPPPPPAGSARSPRPPRRAATTHDPRPRPTALDGDAADTTNLRDALEIRDTRFVLRELYREITTMAEEMWTDRPPTTPTVWDRVRVSPWYTEQFSRIGLKPVSDFYEVLAAFNDRLATGISTLEVQEFLKDRNFASILLALRDMFQKQQV